MATRKIPEPFETIFSTVFNVNALGPGWKRNIDSWLDADPAWPRRFRKQWADAILRDVITPEEYEALTSHHFAKPEYLREFLAERWKLYYGYELTSDEYIFEAPPEPEEA